jgi:hypothetical protein
MMTNDFMKRTRTTVRNGYGVETRPEYLADCFAIYDNAQRAKILNDWDAASDSFDGSSPQETADNLSLRMRLEAMHQALRRAGR